MPLTCAYAVSGMISGYRRPLCVRALRVPGPFGALTGTDGGVAAAMRTVLPGFLPPTWHFRKCLLASKTAASAWSPVVRWPLL
jgi:hypothetical protein